MSQSTQVSTVQFHNQTLITFEQDNLQYVAMKPICENIGLNWDGQRQRIQRDEVLNSTIVIITTPTNGGEQQMLCLPIDYLNGWLFGIDINRCKPEIRETLIMYKKECYKALFDYWNKGIAVKSAVKIEKLSKEHQTFIKNLVMDRTKMLPKEHQAKAAITQWSALKTHFGKSYKDINDDQFVEAVSLLARLPLEGELIINEPSKSEGYYLTESEFCKVAWAVFSAKQQNQLLEKLIEPLNAIQSRLTSDVWDYAREYKSTWQNGMEIMSRLVEDLEVDRHSPLNLQRIKQHLADNQRLI